AEIRRFDISDLAQLLATDLALDTSSKTSQFLYVHHRNTGRPADLSTRCKRTFLKSARFSALPRGAVRHRTSVESERLEPRSILEPASVPRAEDGSSKLTPIFLGEVRTHLPLTVEMGTMIRWVAVRLSL